MPSNGKLNVGCGNLQRDGWLNIDISTDVDPDEVVDISKGLPYGDCSFSEVHAGCVIEQVEDLGFVMNEIWRVLEPGGELNGYVPSDDPRVTHLDPMDRRWFKEQSFDYFDGSKHHWQEFGRNYGYRPWKDVETSVNDNGILHFVMRKPCE